MSSASSPKPLPARQDLRERLLTQRSLFVASTAFKSAEESLARELRGVLLDLEPSCLGLYWPLRGEFNARAALAVDGAPPKSAWALPFARRTPLAMEYRAWDGLPSDVIDECGIPSGRGPAVVPDVVLVPCVGFTDDGLRLGYGGGYFDRWLAAHPGVCAVGVAWARARIDASEFAPQPHDHPLSLVVTEDGPA